MKADNTAIGAEVPGRVLNVAVRENQHVKLQGFMHSPVIDVGLLMTVRGFGTMFSMMIVGRIAGKVDLRYVIAAGKVLVWG